jgi:hypothetical protein
LLVRDNLHTVKIRIASSTKKDQSVESKSTSKMECTSQWPPSVQAPCHSSVQVFIKTSKRISKVEWVHGHMDIWTLGQVRRFKKQAKNQQQASNNSLDRVRKGLESGTTAPRIRMAAQRRDSLRREDYTDQG